MALIALLFAHHDAGSEVEPAAMRTVAGLSVIERQVRQARACGAGRVIVAVERMPPALAATLAALSVEVVRTADGVAIDAEDRVLVIEDALLVDPRIIAAVVARGGVAVWKGRSGPERSQRIDPTSHWAGVSVYPGSLVSAVMAGLGDWDLQETLLRAAFADEKPFRTDVGAIETYDVGRRRAVPMIWLPVRSDADAVRAGEMLLAAGRSGCPDWPDRYINSPIEDGVVRVAIGAGITVGVLRAATFLCGVAAAAAFAIGWLWPGLILALMTAPIDGAARKLAWARHELPAEHLFIDWLWYLALAAHFALVRDAAAPWALVSLILIASWGRSIHEQMYQRFTARPLDDAGDFERRLRLLGSRRNTNLWLLLPFAVFGAWYAGFVALGAYATATFVATQVRFFSRLTDYARAHSPRMAANLAADEGRSASIFWRWLSPK